MVRAVANRPAEQFQTDAAGPEWEVQGGDNALLEMAPPNDEPFVDADGNPVERDGPPLPPEEDRGLRPDEGLPPDDEGLGPDDGGDIRDLRGNADAGALIGA
jgi:penicillin-binding protein 1A